MTICRKGHHRDDSEARCRVCWTETKAAIYQRSREAISAKNAQLRLDAMAYRALTSTTKESGK